MVVVFKHEMVKIILVVIVLSVNIVYFRNDVVLVKLT